MNGHGGSAGLCEQDHFCPNCEDDTGELCLDLFEHPICQLVACATEARRCEAPDCVKRKHKSSRYCSMHRARLYRHGDLNKVTTLRTDPVQRFWSKVDRRELDECWPWLGTLTGTGYGVFKVGPIQHMAHRFSYTLNAEQIPGGMEIDHVKARGCARRDCVNPAHLEAVTPRENLARSDAFSAVNRRKKVCPKCGGEYTRLLLPNGRWRRLCKPCKAARARLRGLVACCTEETS